MNATDWALALVWVATVPQTLFILIYGTTNQWWLSWIGRALFTSSLALALLLNMSLVAYYYHDLLDQRESNVVIGLVALGSCLKLFALLLDKRPGSRDRFNQGSDDDRLLNG
jgi:hypothetical protein